MDFLGHIDVGHSGDGGDGDDDAEGVDAEGVDDGGGAVVGDAAEVHVVRDVGLQSLRMDFQDQRH